MPSGWYHQVENLEDTISINHNWFNGSNVLKFIWKNLESAFKSVEAEISDCKEGSTDEEFSKMCQDLLRASHGMNFEDFLDLLDIVASKRISFLTDGVTRDATSDVMFDGWKLGRHHAQFDLRQIKDQLEILKSYASLRFLSDKISVLSENISELQNQFRDRT